MTRRPLYLVSSLDRQGARTYVSEGWERCDVGRVGVAIADCVRVPVVVLDGALRIRAANWDFCTLVGAPFDGLDGLSLLDVDGGAWDTPTLRRLLDAVRSGGSVAGQEVVRRVPGGRAVYGVNARGVSAPEPGGEPSIVVALHEITALRPAPDDGAPSAITGPVRALFDRLPVPTYVWRAEGDAFTLEDFNEAAGLLTRGRIHGILGLRPTAIWPDHPELAADLARSLAEQVVVKRELVLTMRSTGERRRFSLTIGPLPPDRVLVHAEDTTERHRAEAAVRASEGRLRLMVQQLPAVLWTVDTDGRFTSWAGAGLAPLGLAAGERGDEEPPARTVGEFLGVAADRTEALRMVARALAGESVAFEQPLNGRVLQVHVEPMRSEAGPVIGALGLSIDITERKALEAQLAHQAFHDALTGLANRALFHDRVEHALARSARADRGTTGASTTGALVVDAPAIAVLLVDLDQFKTVNDSLGHAAGDALLVAVARRLRAATRGSDTVARLGGDEFAVLLEDMMAPSDAAVAADRILAALHAPVVVDGKAVTVGASVGIAAATATSSPDTLLRNADLALYAAKAEGRGRVVAFASAMHDAAVERLELEADLRAAVDALSAPGVAPSVAPAATTELRLVYQPIVDLDTGRTWGVEALLRWCHAGRGAVAPSVFVPVAEETGLILPLGRWVLAEACRQAVAWSRRDGGAPLAVSVNVSGRQFEDAAFVEDVRDALAASGLPPARLTLEITESVMMRDPNATLDRLLAVKALGVGLAIDDFGTGYSSLAYLREYPVDVLKIDKSFVASLGRGADETVIARAIVSLGTALSLVMVAEGVENAAQLERLRALGCHRAQGYLFAAPLTPDAVPDAIVHFQATRPSRRAVGAEGS